MKKKTISVSLVVGLVSLLSVGSAYALWVNKKIYKIDNPPLGQGRDGHGCLVSSGYSWCELKQRCFRSPEQCLPEVATSTSKDGAAPLIGGQKDDHGCLLGAGYSWCEAKQKCLRPWEEKCTATSTLHAYMTYQPMQCEEEPWQAWYREGHIQFIKAPTDEELIKAYYATQSVSVISAKKIDSGALTCEACSVCRKPYSFSVVVADKDAGVMKRSGWK